MLGVIGQQCCVRLHAALSPVQTDATLLDVTCCVRFHTLLHVVPQMFLRVVAQSLKPVKLFSQQVPTFLLFCDRRSVAQQCKTVCTALPTLLGPRTLITHVLQRLIGCILPTMHCRSQHCWELLHPFTRHCQHARNNSQHCWRNNVGSCCARSHVALEMKF